MHYYGVRDINFKVSQVTRQDVIHAGPKLVPAIFKVVHHICTVLYVCALNLCMYICAVYKDWFDHLKMGDILLYERN